MKPAKKPDFDLLSLVTLRRRKKNVVDKKYASFNRRMLAAAVDSFLMMIFVAPFLETAFMHLWPLPAYWLQHPPATRQEILAMLQSPDFQRRWLADTLLQTGALFAVTGLFWRFWSATPGKMLLGLKLADADSEAPLTGRQIMRRLCGYAISFLCLFAGFFWISFDKRHQGWHDKLAHSVVLVRPWREHVLYQAFQLLVGKVSRHHQEGQE